MSTPEKADIAVLIGRFQPFHKGHQLLLAQALAVADQVIVVIGSAFQARTPKNPFTWQERAALIRATLAPADQHRVHVLPQRDLYDEEKWRDAVCSRVQDMARQLLPSRPARITLIGHHKDTSSSYLAGFEGWTLLALPRNSPIDATQIRAAYFSRQSGATGWAEQVPPETLRFLQDWQHQPVHAELAREWQMLQDYKKAWSAAPYPPVFVTVDAVVRCAGKVLLIRRGQAPGVGLHALPGGFIEQRETAFVSALRELQEETSWQVPDTTMRRCLQASAVFDHPDRSQRGRTITHAFYFDLGEQALPVTDAADDAQAVFWVDLQDLARMEDRFHDDHFHILDHFLGLTAPPPR